MKFILPRFFFNCERWKWNADLRLYVSTHGHFKDEHKHNVACKVRNNYFWVRANHKWLPAHRVVLLTWRPLPVDGEPMTVDHLNSITRDNRLCNLEWVTREENLRRAAENNLNQASNSGIDATKIEDLPFNEPLLSKDIKIQPSNSKLWPQLLKKVFDDEIVFKVGGYKLYTGQELFDAFGAQRGVDAKKENFIRMACRLAARGLSLDKKRIELIRVK